MDWIPFPYTAVMRAADGSTFPVAWFKCNPGAKHLPYLTSFGSSAWNPDKGDEGLMGEIWQYRRPFNHAVLPPGLLGKHVCGTAEQWNFGWDSGETIPIGPGGFPLCCGLEGAYSLDYSLGWDTLRQL